MCGDFNINLIKHNEHQDTQDLLTNCMLMGTIL